MEHNDGLRTEEITTKAFTLELVLEEYSELAFNLEDNFQDASGWIVAYLDYKVLFGKYKDGELFFFNKEQFEPRFLQRLRLFNENKELLLWRNSENTFKGRLRVDNEGEVQEIVEVNQFLVGTKEKRLDHNSWTEYSEERGSKIVLPFYVPVDAQKARIAIKTRNYIGYNCMGQAGYEDSRFVAFTIGGEAIGEG